MKDQIEAHEIVKKREMVSFLTGTMVPCSSAPRGGKIRTEMEVPFD